jgi:hypothetical protein
MTGIVLMITGSILLVIGLIVFNLSAKDKKQATNGSESDKIVGVEKNSIHEPKEMKIKTFDSPEKKGYDFEKYIVQKFDKKYFKIKEWAGDKYINGIYAETTVYPDVLFEFKLNDVTKHFAVECKWRNHINKNGIEFASTAQLDRYRKYEITKEIPVFVAIGIGGTASNPEHLYIIPLKKVKSTVLQISELNYYKKAKNKKFFYDLATETLN